MTRVVSHPDVDAFLARAEPWLIEREADLNIFLSVAYLLRAGAAPFVQRAYLATIESGGEITGCVMRAPPDGVYLTEFDAAAIPVVVAQLRAQFESVPEVTGPEQLAVAFALGWSGERWHLHSRHSRYVLKEVVPRLKAAPGALRLGRREDGPILDEWGAAYGRETGVKVDAAALFRRMLDRGWLYVWDDGAPRCVVTASGRTPNGARISAVYTPPAFRGNGYAANAVTAVSRLVLEGGKRFCVITADAADPIPNSIYRRIGFRPTGEVALLHFD
jgi:GNAT superfamily N-acetyltransferase